MKISDMSVKDVMSRGIKKCIMEMSSVKFWGAVWLGWLNAHIILADHKVDVFLITAFLVLLGIREASDILQQQKGGDPK